MREDKDLIAGRDNKKDRFTSTPGKGILFETKTKIIVGIGVILTVFLVYLYTMAPTTAFWDCGEFISVSYILGVPHPPGTPLYVLIGRIFSLLPIAPTVAQRVTLISVITGSFAAFFIYLIVLKIIEFNKQLYPGNKYKYIGYIVAVTSAFLGAFAFSVWDNAVEAEVYSPSALIGLGVTYLAMRWRELEEKDKADNRIVLFITYILFLSAGIHMTPLMLLFPLIVYGFIIDKRTVPIFLFGIIVILIALMKQPWYFYLILLVLYGVYLFFLSRTQKLDWKLIVWSIVLILIAISVQFYLMVRAKHNPSINEVSPTTWDTFLQVIRREQYAPMRLLPRKTSFDIEEQMGTHYPTIVAYFWQIALYVRYMLWQWRWEWIIGFIPIFMGLYGLYVLFKHDKKTFALIGGIYIVASIGLVTYLNLRFSPSDPNPDHIPREVRERDYFFAFSYIFFTIFIGVALLDIFKKIRKNILPRIHYIFAAGTILLGIYPVFANMNKVTRRGDYIPEEYGYNLLISCRDNSVLFTNGDNDTFPLWFVQEVLGVKKSVVNANLSLLNTPWYIKQLKRKGVPISFSDQEIDMLQPLIQKDMKRVLLIKDIMIRDIIATNAGIKLNYPDDYRMTSQEFQEKVLKNYKENKMHVYFSSTVSSDSRVDVEPYLRREGLVFLVTNSTYPKIDLNRTIYLITKAFRYKSMKDKHVRKDENTKGLLVSYAALFLLVGEELYKRGNIDGAIYMMEQGKSFDIPDEAKVPFYYNLSYFYAEKKDFNKARIYLDSSRLFYPDDPEYYRRKGIIEQMAGNYGEAERNYKILISRNPDDGMTIKMLLDLYLDKMKDTAKAIALIEEWYRRHPADTSAVSLIKKLKGEEK